MHCQWATGWKVPWPCRSQVGKWQSLNTGLYSEHMTFENLESNEANVPYSLPANVLVFKLQTSWGWEWFSLFNTSFRNKAEKRKQCWLGGSQVSSPSASQASDLVSANTQPLWKGIITLQLQELNLKKMEIASLFQTPFLVFMTPNDLMPNTVFCK